MVNFRDLIINRVEDLITWGGDAPTTPDPANDFNKGMLIQDSANFQFPNYHEVPTNAAVPANDGFFTPIRQVYRRPHNPKVLEPDKFIPSIFIFMDNASRPADVKVSIGNTAETIFIGLQIVLKEGFGMADKQLTDQVNGVITDIDSLINPESMRNIDFERMEITPALTPKQREFNQLLPRYSVKAGGIIDWFTAPGEGGSPNEIVSATLGVVVSFPAVIINPS